ncbi:MAG: hypothetical protein U9Q85_02235, partial [Patescibacteria group bacterium]|nr:hypothetical protein [Patescibacteria group bacterium]
IEEKLGAKIDGLITAVDNINKKYEDHKLERMSNQVAHDRMEADIEKHDSRIGKLELKAV